MGVRVGNITVDCNDVIRVAEFWSEGKASKNRMHVDVFDPSPDVIDRLASLGAVVLEEHELSWADHRWTVMQDPEGNEFCVGARPFGGT